MNTTISNTDVSIGSEIIQKAPDPKARRDPIWPVLVALLGLLASLAWSGFLGWIVGRMIGAL
jgi:hypothetical protein